MALAKVNNAVAGLVFETQTNMAVKIGDYLKEKVGEQYDDEFADAVAAMIEEFKSSEIKEVKPEKATRAKKDPNAPKRAPTEYNKFIKSKMEELKPLHPELKGRALMAEAAKHWKKAVPELKVVSESEPETAVQSEDELPKPAKGKAAKGKKNA
jgi:hypothetical protein